MAPHGPDGPMRAPHGLIWAYMDLYDLQGSVFSLRLMPHTCSLHCLHHKSLPQATPKFTVQAGYPGPGPPWVVSLSQGLEPTQV